MSPGQQVLVPWDHRHEPGSEPARGQYPVATVGGFSIQQGSQSDYIVYSVQYSAGYISIWFKSLMVSSQPAPLVSVRHGEVWEVRFLYNYILYLTTRKKDMSI